MNIKVLIPTPLRQFAEGRREVEVEASTAGEALESLTNTHPDLRSHLYKDGNTLRNFINVYVGDEDIRHLQGQETKLSDGDSIMIVPSIAGGLPDGAPETAQLPELSNEEVARYSRHLILPEVGVEGQRKLKSARVLMIGTGGLGSPAGLYLAAAGIGTLGIVDFDRVDESNLQRQILHGTKDVGRPKIESARDRLTDLNPNVRIEAYEERLTSENALEIFRGYDVIVDGTDNFPTRYLVNDASVLTGIPNVYGSIFRFEGQASIFGADEGACYRCLYPEPPPPGLVPSCAEGGVLGVLPGIVGSIQANEAIKVILGADGTLVNRLLLFDAWTMSFREMKLRKDPDCPVCGAAPTVTELIDYEEFCGIGTQEDEDNELLEISAAELNALVSDGERIQLIDVREPHEQEIARIPGARLIPLGDIGSRASEIDPGIDTVVLCKSGVRSAKAIRALKDKGFEGKLINLKGGITAWSTEVDPSVPKY